MNEQRDSGPIASRLNQLLGGAGLAELAPEVSTQFEAYYALLLRWNSRVNLTAIRDEEAILRRHFVESIACARALPEGIRTLLDFGSGGGFPGVPIAICRPELDVTLAESQGKKAAFLREVVRTCGLKAKVHGARAETLGKRFDCVTLRAVDKMERAIESACGLVGEDGWLAVLGTVGSQDALLGLDGFGWNAAVPLPGGEQRVLMLGRQEHR